MNQREANTDVTKRFVFKSQKHRRKSEETEPRVRYYRGRLEEHGEENNGRQTHSFAWFIQKLSDTQQPLQLAIRPLLANFSRRSKNCPGKEVLQTSPAGVHRESMSQSMTKSMRGFDCFSSAAPRCRSA